MTVPEYGTVISTLRGRKNANQMCSGTSESSVRYPLSGLRERVRPRP